MSSFSSVTFIVISTDALLWVDHICKQELILISDRPRNVIYGRIGQVGWDDSFRDQFWRHGLWRDLIVVSDLTCGDIIDRVLDLISHVRVKLVFLALCLAIAIQTSLTDFHLRHFYLKLLVTLFASYEIGQLHERVCSFDSAIGAWGCDLASFDSHDGSIAEGAVIDNAEDSLARPMLLASMLSDSLAGRHSRVRDGHSRGRVSGSMYVHGVGPLDGCFNVFLWCV